MKDKKVGKIKITQVRSVINRLPDQKENDYSFGTTTHTSFCHSGCDTPNSGNGKQSQTPGPDRRS